MENEVLFWNSQEGKAAQSAKRIYVLLFNQTGSFQVEKVPPGSYQLEITPRKPGEGSQQAVRGEPYGTIKMDITVPEAQDEQVAVDLGTLILTRSK